MKIERNQKYFTIARYAMFTIVASALAILAIFNFDELTRRLSFITTVAIPIIIGIFSAYILNPLMMYMENGWFGKWARSEKKSARTRARAFALTLTMLIVLAVLVLLIILVIPQLAQNIITLFDNFEGYLKHIRSFVEQKMPALKDVIGAPIDDLDNLLSNIWENHSSEVVGFAGNIASGIMSVLDGMKNFFIGLTIAVYLLAKKEMFIGQSKKLLFAFVKPERSQRILNVCREASKKFLGSIIGKIIEAFLVGVLMFLVLRIVGMPYAPLISTTMFLFNLIPFVGPIIGAVPCSLLLLLSDTPSMTIWFLVIVLVLQTIDGNIIAPWILGDSTGLPAVWVLIAIVIGGGFFKIPGMLLGVPVCAVLYMLFKDYVENRLKKRNLPQNTVQYVGNVDYITKDYVYTEPEDDIVDKKDDVQPEKKVPKVFHLREKIRKKSIEHNKKVMNSRRLITPRERRENKAIKKENKESEKDKKALQKDDEKKTD